MSISVKLALFVTLVVGLCFGVLTFVALDYLKAENISQMQIIAERLQYRMLLSGVIALGLAWLGTFVFSGGMILNLGELKKALDKVGAGHLEGSTEIASDDEIASVARSLKKMKSSLQERERLKNTLVKFDSVEDSEKLLSGEIKLKTEKKRMTVLFFNLYGFSFGTAKPDEMAQALNVFWSEITAVMSKYLGFIDSQTPNSLKVIWGALDQINDEGASALAAALDIRKIISHINEKREKKDLPPVEVGVGIHTGDVVSGVFGRGSRSEYTFLGEDVTLATKVALATKELNFDILVSEETQTLLKNKGFAFGPTIQAQDSTLVVCKVIGRKTSDGVIESDLSKSEREAITPEPFAHVEQNVTAVPVAHHSPQPQPQTESNYRFDMPASNQNVGTAPFILQSEVTTTELPWYLMRNVNTGVTDGPYNLMDLRTLVEQPGFPYTEAYAFRDGDTVMTHIMQVPGISRRQPPAPIPTHLPFPEKNQFPNFKEDDWFVQKEDAKIYGPYSLGQIINLLGKREITRTTYCWKQGLPAWIYAFQIPGVDRRGSTPPPPPIPIPKNRAS